MSIDTRRLAAAATVLALATSTSACAQASAAAAPGTADQPAAPAWAYPVPPAAPAGAAPPSTEATLTLHGSAARYSPAQLASLFHTPEWRPQLHPSMPEVVARGRKPNVFACAYCHHPTGAGRPENANLTGLSATYMRQQLADYKSGHRRSSVAGFMPTLGMALTAKNATDAEVDEAIRYFTGLPRVGFVRVEESDTVPLTEPRGWMLKPTGAPGTEAIGKRIVEIPRDVVAAERRDPTAAYVAYVPRGSIARGQALAQGGAAIPACASCHGAALQGMGDVPPLAGRSPSFLYRQLWDFVSGARQGPQAAAMIAIAKALSPDERLALAAYAASLAP